MRHNRHLQIGLLADIVELDGAHTARIGQVKRTQQRQRIEQKTNTCDSERDIGQCKLDKVFALKREGENQYTRLCERVDLTRSMC